MQKIGDVMRKLWLWMMVLLLLVGTAFALPVKIIKTDINPDKAIVGSAVRFTAYLQTDDEKPLVTATITFPSGEVAILEMMRDEKKDVISIAVEKAYYLEFYKSVEDGTYMVNFNARSEKDTDTVASEFEIINQDFVLNYVDKVKEVAKITNQTTINVFGTEYQPFDSARVFTQLIEGEDPINDAVCFAYVYYPNNALMLNGVVMPYLNGSDGLYYYDFIAPNVTGVYMVSVHCDKPAQVFIDSFDDFSKLYAYENVTDGGMVHLLNSSEAVCNGTCTACATRNQSSCVDGCYWAGCNYSKDYTDGGFEGIEYLAATLDAVAVNYSICNLTNIQQPNISVCFYASQGSGNTGNITVNGVNTHIPITFPIGTVPMNYTCKGVPKSFFHNGVNRVGYQCGVCSNGKKTYFGTDTTYPDNTSYTYLYPTGYTLVTTFDFAEKLVYTTANCTGTCTTCGFYGNQIGCEGQSGCYWTPEEHYTSGYVESVLVNLTYDNWHIFNAIYELFDGSIDFYLLDENDTVVCNGLGDIETCAENETRLKLFANITRPDPFNISPEIDEWWLTLTDIAVIEQIKGGGELHITSHLLTNQNMLAQIINYLQNVIYNFLDAIFNKLVTMEAQLNQTVEFGEETNATTHIIDENLLAINKSMHDKFDEKDAHIQSAYDNLTQQITEFKANSTENFNHTWWLISQIEQGENQSHQEILDFLHQIDTHVNNTLNQVLNVNQSIINNMNSINQSLSTEIEGVQNDTTYIITLISDLNMTNTEQYNNLHGFLQNLTIQIDNNFNLTQQNITDLTDLLLVINLSITTDIDLLNSSLFDVRDDILTEINISYTTLININQSLSTQISSINASIQNTINDFRLETESNFNTTYWWLEHLDLNINGTRLEMLDGLYNLSLQLNETKWQLHAHIDSINNSLWKKMDEAQNLTQYAIDLILNLSLEFNASNQDVLDYLNSMNTNITSEFSNIDGDFNFTWELINNISQNVNFTPVLNAINNVSIQIDNNFNITQSNFTQVWGEFDALNESVTNYYLDLNTSITNFEDNFDNYTVWVNGTLVEMKQEISNIENMTFIINQTVVQIYNDTNWLVIWHQQWDDLRLSVEAPTRCLNGTNWLVRAQVTDRFGGVQSPLDDVYCNITTDLWGEAAMGYEYLPQKWKYIHQCDPAYTIFNWSITCDYYP
jgi:hypothetical protein